MGPSSGGGSGRPGPRGATKGTLFGGAGLPPAWFPACAATGTAKLLWPPPPLADNFCAISFAKATDFAKESSLGTLASLAARSSSLMNSAAAFRASLTS